MSAERQQKIRTILVDDEELARAILRESLAAHEEIEIVAECDNGFAAVKTVGELQPDLVFLDIQMPKLDGFEVLELIGSEPVVVFVTAYDQYALRAFEVNAVDYLLKPYADERFELALTRARQRLESQTRPELDAGKLSAAARRPGEFANRIVLRDGGKVHILPVEKLEFAEAQDDYVSLAGEGRRLLKQQTITALEKSLDPQKFVRVHRSYLLNIEQLKQIEPYGKESHVAILQCGARLPVSRSGYARLREILDGQA
jgi:two-component system LytT family response regulator